MVLPDRSPSNRWHQILLLGQETEKSKLGYKLRCRQSKVYEISYTGLQLI